MVQTAENTPINIQNTILAELRKPKGVLFSTIFKITNENVGDFLKIFGIENKASAVNQIRKKQFMDSIAKYKSQTGEVNGEFGSKILDALDYINISKDKTIEVLVIGYDTKSKNNLDKRLRFEYLGSTVTAQSLLLSNGFRADIESIVIADTVDKKIFEQVFEMKFPEGNSIEFAIYILEKNK